MSAVRQDVFRELLDQLDEQMREKCVLVALACAKTPADLETHTAISDALIEIVRALPKTQKLETTTPSV